MRVVRCARLEGGRAEEKGERKGRAGRGGEWEMRKEEMCCQRAERVGCT